MKRYSLIASVVVVLTTGAAARAGDAPYLGAWRIESAVLAPWADPARPLDPAEKTELVGKTVVLRPGAITGPGPLVCKGPHYKLTHYTADMLFQGELDELHRTNPKVTAAGLAAALGFTGTSWRTLETACEIDWHFTGPRSAKLGLNDYVYTLTKR